jgi:endonuclease/exonuclease/phosphatase family metal-dependent hydrolase
MGVIVGHSFLVCFIVFGSSSLSWAIESVSANQKVITILSYNVHGLPPVLAPVPERFARIGDVLAKRRAQGTEPDVIVLQEMFTPRTKEIIERSGYPYVYKGAGKNVAAGKIFGSGLVVLSNFPFLSKRKHSYALNACAGWDCFAHKGVVHVRIEIPGVPDPLDVLNTHLNAKSYENRLFIKDPDKAREKQIYEVKKFLEVPKQDSFPIIFPADFNLKPSRKNFDLLLSQTELLDAGATCLSDAQCVVGSDTKPEEVYEKTVDHHLFRSGEKVKVKPIFVERNFSQIVDGSELSDHLGYEIQYLLSWE